MLASAAFGEEEIPPLEGAVARLGLGCFGCGERVVGFSPGGKYLAVMISTWIELWGAYIESFTQQVLSSSPLSSWYSCGPETGSGFDALASHDPDEETAKYKWNLDERTPKQGCSEPSLRRGFTSMTLVVADDEGVTARNDVEIQLEVGEQQLQLCIGNNPQKRGDRM